MRFESGNVGKELVEEKRSGVVLAAPDQKQLHTGLRLSLRQEALQGRGHVIGLARFCLPICDDEKMPALGGFGYGFYLHGRFSFEL
jgi:hypothetical protein